MIGRASLDVGLEDVTRLQLEVWYPALPGRGERDYAITGALKTEMIGLLGIPSFALSTRETSRGLRGLEPVPQALPVIVFSHGFASFSRQNTRQLEALAKAGYLVLAVSHPGESLTTEYQDGTVVTIDHDQPALEFLRKRDKKALNALARELNVHLSKLAHAQTDSDYLAALDDVEQFTLNGESVPSSQRRMAQLIELAKRQSGVCEINIETAAHNNFTDLGWVTPLKWFGQLGPVNNREFSDWLDGFLVSYFDHHLKGMPYAYPLWESATLTGEIHA